MRLVVLLLFLVSTTVVSGCVRAQKTVPPSQDPAETVTVVEKTQKEPVAAPSAPQILLDPEQTINYRCSNGVTFQVQADTDKARVVSGGHEVILPRVPSASGVKYQEGRNLYWNKGDTAEVEVVGRRFSDCTIAWSQPLREEARKRGIWVWAMGHEPDWLVEIGDNHFFLITDQGQSRQEFRTPIPVRVPETNDILYRITSPRQVDLILAEKLCRDSKNGEYFFAEATLTVDGTTMSGCAEFLYR